MGKCILHSEKLINPATGEVITIEEAVQGQMTNVLNLGGSGKYKLTESKISDWIDSGVKPVWRVTTRLGRSVAVTGHHPFLAVHGWTPLHDLKVGEKIAVPRTVPVFGKNDTLSREQVRLLAYYIAEGSLTGRAAVFINTDPLLVADFTKCIRKTFPSLVVSKRKEHPSYTATARFYELAKEPAQRLDARSGFVGQARQRKILPAANLDASAPQARRVFAGFVFVRRHDLQTGRLPAHRVHRRFGKNSPRTCSTRSCALASWPNSGPKKRSLKKKPLPVGASRSPIRNR